MKRTLKMMVLMLGVVTIAMEVVSCDSTAKQEREKIQKRLEKAETIERRIITPEDFYVFASRTSDTSSWSDIDDVIQCMSADKFVNMVDKYANYLVHFSTTDVSRAKVYAILLTALPAYIPDDKEQYIRLQTDVLGNSPYFKLSDLMLGWSLGKDGFNNVQHEYVRAIKDNGKLYKGQIIPLENLFEYTISSDNLNTKKNNRNDDYGQDETFEVEESSDFFPVENE